MSSKKISLLLLVFISLIIVMNAGNTFLDNVKNNFLVHHAETNTVWEYIGSYSQIDSTINFITEIPVFQFLCDVLPVRMAYALRGCIEYRSLLLKNSDVTRLKEVAEIHAKSRTKRQTLERLIAGGTAYGLYRVVGDLLGPSNQNLAHRLEDVENFKEHQQVLKEVMNTVIASLRNHQLSFIKAFKDVYDHIRQVIAFRNEYDSFAKHAIVQEMRQHYDKIVQSRGKVEEHKLNLDFLSPDQRSITYDFVYQRVKTLLPENFGESLSVFMPRLLVHRVLSFTAVSKSAISYELTEKDFQCDVSVDPKFEKLNYSENYRTSETFQGEKERSFQSHEITLFYYIKKATQISHIPTYFTLSPDGHSSEWENHDDRRCTFDKQTKYMFCAIPTPI